MTDESPPAAPGSDLVQRGFWRSVWVGVREVVIVVSLAMALSLSLIHI